MKLSGIMYACMNMYIIQCWYIIDLTNTYIGMYVRSKVKANSVQSLPSIHMNVQYVRRLSKGWRTALKDIQTIIMTM